MWHVKLYVQGGTGRKCKSHSNSCSCSQQYVTRYNSQTEHLLVTLQAGEAGLQQGSRSTAQGSVATALFSAGEVPCSRLLKQLWRFRHESGHEITTTKHTVLQHCTDLALFDSSFCMKQRCM